MQRDGFNGGLNKYADQVHQDIEEDYDPDYYGEGQGTYEVGVMEEAFDEEDLDDQTREEYARNVLQL
jgi:hypothetical protein